MSAVIDGGLKLMRAGLEISPELRHGNSETAGSRASVSARKRQERRGSARDYSFRLAFTPEEKIDAFRLRFLVFNVELKEGLESAYATGYDSDEFDSVCDHLIVEHKPSGRVVATYRMQTGASASANLGYYGEREFDFSPFEPLRDSLVEVGRVAILKEHRTFEVLNLLWKGIGAYGRTRRQVPCWLFLLCIAGSRRRDRVVSPIGTVSRPAGISDKGTKRIWPESGTSTPHRKFDRRPAGFARLSKSWRAYLRRTGS
jgi:Acetyltransferase (GNAT) domain